MIAFDVKRSGSHHVNLNLVRGHCMIAWLSPNHVLLTDPLFRFHTVVSLIVACGAECDEILLGIIAGLTAKLFVVDLQVRHRATRLTAPPIATQHLVSKGFRTPLDLGEGGEDRGSLNS